MEHCYVLQQLSAVAHTLNTECRWGLSPEVLQSYAEAMSRYCPAPDRLDAAVPRTLLLNYHYDHPTVAALQDSRHAEHLDAWQQMQSSIRTMLAQLHLPPGSTEDVLQEACKDIWWGLPQFRYDSRLSTWLYRVVVNSAKRSCRAGLAQRRGSGAAPHSLETLDGLGFAGIEAPHSLWPDESALNEDLRRIITAALETAPDTRLQQIFELNFYYQLTVREIGGQLHLSPARVSNLLQQAKQLLSTNPAVCAWFDRELVS